MRLLLAAAVWLQGVSRDELRAGLDTLYGGDFPGAAASFAALAARDTTAAAPLVFEAAAYIWWAESLDSAAFERRRIDSLLGHAITRARAGGEEFWLATALGYRARERELHGSGLSAAQDAKAMRDGYARVLAADSSCHDCYLGLGVYDYGLARAGTVPRLVARLIGLGGGNAARGILHLRRAARDGDLARVEARWVLAAALVREARREESRGPELLREARALIAALAERYPGNPVFRQFLRETS